MSEDMIGRTVVRELPGLLRDFMQKVLGENGHEWIRAFKLFLKKKNPWQEIKKVASNLLEYLKTVVELPAVACFRTKDFFKITPNDERGSAKVVIGYISDNFSSAFLAGDGKLEKNVKETALRPHKLKKDSLDGPIIAELGGEKVVETSLAHFAEMIRRQGRGQNGILLTNGNVNIFYVRDAEGVLWAVYCNWDSGRACWGVCAISVSSPIAWRAGNQVFSRDSGS